MLRYFLLCLLLLLSGLTAFAQEPPADTKIIFYDDVYVNRLDWFLVRQNICLERVLQLNPELDIHNMTYGEPIIVPRNEPCYLYKSQSLLFSHNQRWHFKTGQNPRLKYYEKGQWLDHPYYTDNMFYISPYGLGIPYVEDLARKLRVCVDDLLAENALLQDADNYFAFSTNGTTLDIFIPQGEPSCDPPPTQSGYKQIFVSQLNGRIKPKFFADTFNVCAEEILDARLFFVSDNAQDYSLVVSRDAKPCYDEEGQRLRYFDEMGRKLDEPIYSDLPVYVTQPEDTMVAIAQRFDVCISDLIRINGFVNMTLYGELELFIPPSRPCPADIEAVQVVHTPLQETSHLTNICKDVLLDLNAPLAFYEDPYRYNRRYSNLTPVNNELEWLIVPTDPSPCYQTYEAKQGESLYDIENKLNRCHEEFTYAMGANVYDNTIQSLDTTVYVPLDSLNCYDAEGLRLYYPPKSTLRYAYYKTPYRATQELIYTDMILYTVQRGDTVYSISQAFNVCVKDLIITNGWINREEGQRIFIPQTLPCYDESTGLPLIYEDEKGNWLDEPIVSDHLIDYGGLLEAPQIYNVCINRIEDANRAKLENQANYPGWIIPTDRPPCLDDDNRLIEYVCYAEAVEMSADYRGTGLSFDNEGTHCYNIDAPETAIWYEGQPYQLVRYRDSILRSRVFTAWCYGVSQDEINAINAEDEVLGMLPFFARLIPMPTRDCYLDHPEILENSTIVHTVENGETLSSIGKLYDMPYQVIAYANDLDADNNIWIGQSLIIPEYPTWRDLLTLVGGISSIVLFFVVIYQRRHRRYTKKKGIPQKRDEM